MINSALDRYCIFAAGKFARAGGKTRVTHFTSYSISTASTQRATDISRELSLFFQPKPTFNFYKIPTTARLAVIEMYD